MCNSGRMKATTRDKESQMFKVNEVMRGVWAMKGLNERLYAVGGRKREFLAFLVYTVYILDET